MSNKPNTTIVMYTTDDGMTKVKATFDNDTVWLSIDQMAELFQRDKSTISRHIKMCSQRENLVGIQLLQILQQLPQPRKFIKLTTIKA